MVQIAHEYKESFVDIQSMALIGMNSVPVWKVMLRLPGQNLYMSCWPQEPGDALAYAIKRATIDPKRKFNLSCFLHDFEAQKWMLTLHRNMDELVIVKCAGLWRGDGPLPEFSRIHHKNWTSVRMEVIIPDEEITDRITSEIVESEYAEERLKKWNREHPNEKYTLLRNG